MLAVRGTVGAKVELGSLASLLAESGWTHGVETVERVDYYNYDAWHVGLGVMLAFDEAPAR